MELHTRNCSMTEHAYTYQARSIMMNHRVRRGITKIELAVLIVVIIILTMLILPIVSQTRTQRASSARDMAQIKLVHQGCLVYAESNPDGALPAPSQCSAPGHECDERDNTTANLYSMLIAQDFFAVSHPVATKEVSEHIVIDEDYNYEAYNPIGESPTFWDPTFVADLATGSNASFAHLPIVGERLKQLWKNSNDPALIVFGTRGPRDGDENDITSDTPSLTHQLYGSDDKWVGNIVMNDNSSRQVDTFYPAVAPHENDNLFRVDLNLNEQGATTPHNATDFLLTFTRNVTVDAEGNAIIESQFD